MKHTLPNSNTRFKYKTLQVQPITPLLYKISEELSEKTKTKMTATMKREEVIHNSQVIIAGPTTKKKEKLHHFEIKYSVSYARI